MKIDMHVHSCYSLCGREGIEHIALTALERGLDGICITDHDMYETGLDEITRIKNKYKDYLMIIRATECTTEKSHTLVYGVQHDIPCKVGVPLQELIQVVDSFGGIAVPAHPYRWGLGHNLPAVHGIVAVEGINGGNSPDENSKAIKLANEHRWFITGGSDAHTLDNIGLIYTEFSHDVSEHTIASALRKGNYRVVMSQEYKDRWYGFGIYNMPSKVFV